MVLYSALLSILLALPFIQGMPDTCVPNPCGSNTQCYMSSGRPVCSCPPGHWGNPLHYCQRGECTDSSDCPGSRKCQDYRCIDVCAGQCGAHANCHARNHVPVCTCPPQYTGDPLVACRQMDPQALCHPSPCGQNTQCNVVNGVPTCSCLPGYFGSPTHGCRHECESDYECSPTQQCKNYHCESVCAHSVCAPTAICDARNHRAICTCPHGYFGDPFVSCRAECIVNEDCPGDRPSCQGQKCVDPCLGACGVHAECRVRDRSVAICSCPRDMTGNPFVSCHPYEKRNVSMN